MLDHLDESGPRITVDELAMAEDTLGYALPDEYRRFLLRHNGGRPAPEFFPIEGLDKNPYGAMKMFFGIGHAEESCDLLSNADVMAGMLPEGLLPIGCDNSGSLVCLGVYGEYQDRVLFWDYYDDGPPEERLYSIADTFVDFLASFCDEETALGS